MTIHAACRGCGESVELEPVHLLVSPMAIPHGHKWRDFVQRHAKCTNIAATTQAPLAPTPAVVRPEVEAAPQPRPLVPPPIPPLHGPATSSVDGASPASLPHPGTSSPQSNAPMLIVGPNAEADKRGEGQ